MSDSIPIPGSKDSWGPRVWRVLHNLAWLSDRTDVIYIWKKLMKSLSDVMPCPACRSHLAEYMYSRSPFITNNVHLVKGEEIKNRVVHIIWALHNAVNLRNGKEEFSIDVLKASYTERTRSEIIHETNQILRDIYTEWEPTITKQIMMGVFREWRSNVLMLIGLVSGGPN